jgi:hypothetical protein
MIMVDGYPRAGRGEWQCPDCHAVNPADDSSCRCERDRERTERRRRAAVERMAGARDRQTKQLDGIAEHLLACLQQQIDSDDKIIMRHVRDAYHLAHDALAIARRGR